jgi:hypothetical protein
MESVEPFPVVALLENLPRRSLLRGHVGTVVELHQPWVFEVEFSDIEVRTYVTPALRANQFMILHHDMAKVA